MKDILRGQRQIISNYSDFHRLLDTFINDRLHDKTETEEYKAGDLFNELKALSEEKGIDFNIKTSESLGLKLVVELTKQLKGILESINKEGTTFLITFPDE